MKRREFIILTGVGATGATVLSACGHPENKLIPALIPDNEYVPGLDYWKASTCAMCDAGCGIVVRTREHKANKIEGNPLHPVNRGALCARGQAGLQMLYNPDRIRGPLKRAGERGSGQFEEISWDEAIKTLADKLREIKAQGRQDSSAFLTTDLRGVTAHVATRLMRAYGGTPLLTLPLFNEEGAREISWERQNGNIVFDIANATYLLSFGERFLETWRSPVMYSLAYGEFRRATGKARGRFVHTEPRMSLTAANADEWLPAAVDKENLLALAIAQVIAREGLSRVPLSPEFIKELEAFAPEKSAEAIDLPADKIIRIAREFATSERPLAIGSSNSNKRAAAELLNHLVANTQKRGGVILPQPSDYYGPLEKLRIEYPLGGKLPPNYLPALLSGKAYSALLIHRFNPAHITPHILDKLAAGPFIASFSSFMDETAAMSDLVLPDHTSFESWDIQSSYPATKGMVITLSQPVLKPQLNTKQTADVLLAVSRELGGEVAAALPFASAEDIVKQSAADLSKRRGSIKADENPEDFWKTFAERGVWVGEAESATQPTNADTGAAPPTVETLKNMSFVEPQPATGEEYSLNLMIYEHPTLGDGSFANLPGLQELPDSMTGVMWGSWVEVNPKTAASLGIADGDLVEVVTRHGSLRVPAVLYPAIRPDTIAMPFGQGHTAYGRYAKDRGANVAALLPQAAIGSASSLKMIYPAKVSKAAGEANLIRFGTDLLEKIENDRSR
ncbi:MAG TPA: molybdopterin-dependent oxidoreductase [Blastocatellia bacterium]|nr:molybdopterin-dependent oxidoreductase [Blastocatellia bacterium]